MHSFTRYASPRLPLFISSPGCRPSGAGLSSAAPPALHSAEIGVHRRRAFHPICRGLPSPQQPQRVAGDPDSPASRSALEKINLSWSLRAWRSTPAGGSEEPKREGTLGFHSLVRRRRPSRSANARREKQRSVISSGKCCLPTSAQ